MLYYLKISKRTLRVRKYGIYQYQENKLSKMGNTQHPKVEITVENFGPIPEANIDLRPLSVFVGPSNTGKTYFATLVYALHGIFDGFLRIPLPNSFRSFYSMVSDSRNNLTSAFASTDEEVPEIVNKLSTKHRNFTFLDLPKGIREFAQTNIEDSEIWQNDLGTELKRCLGLHNIAGLTRRIQDQNNEMRMLINVREEKQEFWSFNITTKNTDIVIDGTINEDMILLDEHSWLSEEDGLNLDELLEISPEIFPGLKRRNLNRYYLPAARSGIMQSHQVIASSVMANASLAGLEQIEIPTLSGVIADFMQKIILYDVSKPSENDVSHLSNTIESDVIKGRIISTSSQNRYPVFLYHPSDVKEDIRLTQASSMVTELAPLVLYLRSLVQPGDTLIIEEPEAHLHPGAQADMAVILARLVRAGVRVIITTHSDWLLQEIGNLILEGLIDEKTDEQPSWLRPEEVGAWHFQKDEPVKEIAFHSRKGFSPKDYNDVAEGLYNRSVNLQQKYEKQKGESTREST